MNITNGTNANTANSPNVSVSVVSSKTQKCFFGGNMAMLLNETVKILTPFSEENGEWFNGSLSKPSADRQQGRNGEIRYWNLKAILT